MLGLAIGFAYDLAAQGHGLVVAAVRARDPAAAGLRLGRGDRARCRRAFVVLVPAAVAAGAALAIGNALADLERDAAGGVASIATRLGAERAWLVQVGLLVAVGLVALVLGGDRRGVGAASSRSSAPPASCRSSRRSLRAVSRPAGRERAWEVEAVGVAALGVAWLWVAVGITTRRDGRRSA